MLAFLAAICVGSISPAPEGSADARPLGSPQGPPKTEQLPEFPKDAFGVLAPFQDDTGIGRRVRMRSAGVADIDGDKNPDLWFLASLDGRNGSHLNELSFQRGVTTGVGRFRKMEVLPTGPWVHAATYRSKGSTAHQLIAVHPGIGQCGILNWNPKNLIVDPRVGQMGGTLTGWKIGPGAFEVATADHKGDGHDDIVVLELTSNGTVVRKLRMDESKYTFLWPASEAKIKLPALASGLRLLDLNGDKETDFVVRIPGYGAIAGIDDGKGSFTLAGNWMFGDHLVDIRTGDLDRDGRDDVALVFNNGVLLQLSRRINGKDSWVSRPLINPSGIRRLVTARFVEVQTKTQLLTFPSTGNAFVHYPTDKLLKNLPIAQVVAGTKPNNRGAGSTGTPAHLPVGFDNDTVVVGDLDNDGDEDVILQHRDLDSWQTLHHPEVDLRPTAIKIVHKGQAPQSKKTTSWIQCQVSVSPQMSKAKILKLEANVYIPDPNSKNAADPDYIYWGRVTPFVNPATNSTQFHLYFNTDEKEWKQRVKDCQTAKDKKKSTHSIVYPTEPQSIYVGNRAFISVHGQQGAQRYSSVYLIHDPGLTVKSDPKKGKSALGARWVLRANPPRPKSDTDLVPWE